MSKRNKLLTVEDNKEKDGLRKVGTPAFLGSLSGIPITSFGRAARKNYLNSKRTMPNKLIQTNIPSTTSSVNVKQEHTKKCQQLIKSKLEKLRSLNSSFHDMAKNNSNSKSDIIDTCDT